MARSSSTATAMLDKPMPTIGEPPRQAEHPVDLFECWCPPVLRRDTLSRAYCSVNGMIGMVTRSSRPSVSVIRPLAQSKSQLSMLRLPKNPIGVSTRNRPAEIKLMIFGGHRGRVMAMLIRATAKATRAPTRSRHLATRPARTLKAMSGRKPGIRLSGFMGCSSVGSHAPCAGEAQ